MSRAALRQLLLGLMTVPLAAAALAAGPDPHLDPSVLLIGCPSCHAGHGASRSPMLPAPQSQVCLRCHDTAAGLNQQREIVAPDAAPPLLSPVLAKPFQHPLTEGAFSEWEQGAVTCTSCHSPHRAVAEPGGPYPTGQRKLSPKSPARFEFELCESCHGNLGPVGQSLQDISRLLEPGNASFHPVKAPAATPSPSTVSQLAGKEVNCTDCHGNDDPQGPRGVHGSGVRHLLRAGYVTVDGAGEAADTYALCYSCHDRQAVLASPRFPEHEMHIVEERASCATCHNPHGSVGNRALIRFGEETLIPGVGPSGRAGRLDFVSSGPGSGACYLTCHGEDHGPEAYGNAKLLVEEVLAPLPGGALPSLEPLPPPGPTGFGRERDRRPPP